MDRQQLRWPTNGPIETKERWNFVGLTEELCQHGETNEAGFWDGIMLDPGLHYIRIGSGSANIEHFPL